MIRASDVGKLMARLQKQAISRGEATIRVDDLQIERDAAGVLTAGLLGSIGHIRLRVHGARRDCVAKLVHTGLAFALANRQGPVAYDMSDNARETLGIVDWTYSWLPGSTETRALCQPQGDLQTEHFGVAEHIGPSVAPSRYERYHAAFVNPHIAGAVDEAPPILYTVLPWLGAVIPGLFEQSSRRWDRKQLDDVSIILEELVENIREHAEDGDRRAKSLVQIALVRGKEGIRLYLTAIDNGVGILPSLSIKLERLGIAQAKDVTIPRFLSGDYGHWHRGRGRSLPNVARRVREQNGTLTIATAPEIQGTAIVVSIPLRVRNRK